MSGFKALTLPVFSDLDEYLTHWVARYKEGIYVRAKVDGAWGSHSLAELEQRDPLLAAYWRGVFAERWRLTGEPAIRVLSEAEIAASGATIAREGSEE